MKLIDPDVFESYISTKIRGVPTPLLMQELRDCMVDFCARTRVWRDKVLIPLVQGKAEYPLGCPRHGQVEHVFRVEYEGRTLKITTEDAEDQRSGTWRTKPGNIVKYYRPTQETIGFMYIPTEDAAAGVTVHVAASPDAAFSKICDVMWTRHREPLRAGVLARLMADTARPWADPPAAEGFATIYERAVSRLVMSRRKGFGRGSQRVTQRPFHRGGDHGRYYGRG